MLNKFILILISLTLSACTLFSNNSNDERLARCKEIKHQLIFNAPGDQLIINGYSGNQIGEAEKGAEMSSLERDYRRLGCS